MAGEPMMTTITVSEARARLSGLVNETAESHEPIQIRGKCNSAVLVSEEDWRAISETLHLVSIPGMAASIRKGLKTPVGKCGDEPGW
jgi:antitoxin YefM